MQRKKQRRRHVAAELDSQLLLTLSSQVKLQYEEDRRKKAERDRMEKERRVAGAAVAPPLPAARPARTAPTSHADSMRGIRSEGHLLSGGVAPPPYGAETAAATDNDVDGADEDEGEDEDDSHDGGNPPGFDGSGRRLGD